MIFQVFSRYSDACGNQSIHFHKFVEAPDWNAVRAIYPHGFFVGWWVETIKVYPLPDVVQQPGPEPR